VARIGGEEESNVRFRLKVKRAEVVVIIPEMEPVGIDKLSVSQGTPQIHAQLNSTHKQKTHAKANAAFSGTLSPKKADAQLTLGLAGGGSVSSERTVEVAGEIPIMTVMLSRTPEGYYRWAIEPTTANYLDGRPWDRTQAPRMKLIDQRKHGLKDLPPAVSVEVRCRREDLIIDDITLKNKSRWEALTRRPGFKNKMAAAESYIRDRLAQEGLAVSNFPDIFGELALASVMAESSG
jgi:hypothetical protein